MLDVHPQFITDTAEKKLVVLPLDEFETFMEELEDIRLLNEAKSQDDGQRLTLSDYLKGRKE